MRRLLFVVVGIFISRATGATPVASFIFPPGGQRGTTVKLIVTGSGLGTLTGMFTTGAGLTATIEPGGDASTRTFDVAIARNAPLGIQQVRFYGPSGLSNVRYFDVGQWPEQDQPVVGAPPIRVTPPCTVNGRLTGSSTRNGVAFTARAGQTVVCEVQALRILGQIDDSWVKGYLEITDGAGRVLESSDGTPDDYYRWDPVIAFTPPRDGEYTAWFRDLNWRGGPTAVYRLTIAIMPHAFGIFPLGGRRGTTVNVHFLGPNLRDAVRQVAIPAAAAETLQVEYAGPDGTTNPRPFQVSDLPDALQNPTNHSLESAQSVSFPCVVSGKIEHDGVHDYYRFHLAKPQHVALEIWSRRLGTPMDSEILLYDSTGKVIADNDDARDRDSRLERDLAAGDFTVRVRDIDNRGGPAYPYRLFIAPPQPRFELVATPDAPTVPIGGSTTLTVRVKRTDGFDGDVSVSVSDLPPGVTASALNIPKGKTEGTVSLSAAVGAPSGPLRIRVFGVGKAGERELDSTARTAETYNIQGTAYQRDLIGPIAWIGQK